MIIVNGYLSACDDFSRLNSYIILQKIGFGESLIKLQPCKVSPVVSEMQLIMIVN